MYLFFFFFKQKTAYDMRISDWSSDVCSSDLTTIFDHRDGEAGMGSADIDGYDVALLRMCCRHDGTGAHRSAPASIAEAPCSASLAPTSMNPNSSRTVPLPATIGRAWCRERVCQSV